MTSNAASEDVTWTRERLIALTAVVTAVAAFGTGLSLGLPLLSLVLEARGVSSTASGLNAAFAGFAIMAVTPFVTGLARRFGTVRILMAASLVAAVSFMGFYFVMEFWVWFPLRLVFHGALAMLFVLSEFWINTLAPERQRGMVLGAYATVLSLGFAAGPAILRLTGAEGIAPFIAGSLLLLGALIPFVFALGLEPDLEEKPSIPFIRFVYAVPLATFGVAAFGAAEAGAMSLLPVYGLRLGYPPETAALLVSALAVGNVLLQLPLGLLADRMDRRVLLGICALVGVVGAALMPFAASNLWLFLPLLVIWGGMIAGLYTVGLAYLGAQYRGSDLAAANAAFIMMYAVGLTGGLPLLGLGLDLWNPHGFAAVLVVVMAAYLAVVMASLRRRG